MTEEQEKQYRDLLMRARLADDTAAAASRFKNIAQRVDYDVLNAKAKLAWEKVKNYETEIIGVSS